MLSWTRVLEDLEKVMPARVHLVSISPELDDSHQLTLKLVVAGDSRDRAIELARRMEESRHFTQTYIQTENAAPTGTGDSVQFTIKGGYVPDLTAPTAPKSETSNPKPATSNKPDTAKRSKR